MTEEEVAPQRRKKALVAALASAVFPGVGFFVLGKQRLAFIFLGLFLLTAVCYRSLSTRFGYAGFLLCALSILTLPLISASLTLLWPGSMLDPGKRALWFAVLIPVAVTSSALWMPIFSIANGLRVFTIASSSMQNAIYKGDAIMSDQRAFRHRSPVRGEVITFHHDAIMLVKRVIALPGDKISGRDGVLFLNGQPLDEPYAQLDGDRIERVMTFPEQTVPAEQLFVVGDYRNYSLDSRFPEFAPVSMKDATGRVLFVISSKHDQTGRTVR